MQLVPLDLVGDQRRDEVVDVRGGRDQDGQRVTVLVPAAPTGRRFHRLPAEDVGSKDGFEPLRALAHDHRAAAADGRFGRTDGCTSLTLRGATVLSDSEPAPIVVAQNWDWLAATRDTVVVVEADCDDRPAYVTFVEAGLLAKAGFNAAGLAVATNFLLSTDDVRGVGVPYHVLLSVLLSCRNLAQAYLALQRLPRVSSANLMLAHRDGGAVDIEAAVVVAAGVVELV